MILVNARFRHALAAQAQLARNRIDKLGQILRKAGCSVPQGNRCGALKGNTVRTTQQGPKP